MAQAKILEKPAIGLKLVKGNIVNKLIIMAPIVAILAACSSAPKEAYERRAYEQEKRQEKHVERAIDQAPKWMTDLPKSASAVYQNGTSVSSDYGMSVNKAKTMAFGKICMSAGGRVNQQSKIYRTDTKTPALNSVKWLSKAFVPMLTLPG